MIIVTLKDYKLLNIPKNTIQMKKNSLDELKYFNYIVLAMDVYKLNIIIPYSDKLLKNIYNSTINSIFIIPSTSQINHILNDNLLKSPNSTISKIINLKNIINKINTLSITNKYMHLYEIPLYEYYKPNVCTFKTDLIISTLIKNIKNNFTDIHKIDSAKYKFIWETNLNSIIIRILQDKQTQNLFLEKLDSKSNLYDIIF